MFNGAFMQIETKQDSLGVRDSSFETESHQQQLCQSLHASLDGGLERRTAPDAPAARRGVWLPAGGAPEQQHLWH